MFSLFRCWDWIANNSFISVFNSYVPWKKLLDVRLDESSFRSWKWWESFWRWSLTENKLEWCVFHTIALIVFQCHWMSPVKLQPVHDVILRPFHPYLFVHSICFLVLNTVQNLPFYRTFRLHSIISCSILLNLFSRSFLMFNDKYFVR